MRILFYSDNFYPETSGISDSIISTARGLKARGHTVGFAAPKYSDANYASVGKPRDEFLLAEGFEVFRIPSLPFAGSASGQARNVIPLGWSLPFVRRFKPDILHSQTPFGTGFEALWASRLFGVPLVGTNHTHIHEFIRIYGPIRTKWAETIMQRFFSWYYNRSRSVSVVAQKLLVEMRQHGFKREADIVPNPLSLSVFSPATAAEKTILRKGFGLSGPTLMYAGRIAPEKRLDAALKAFKILLADMPDARFVIAGNGPADQETRNLARDLGISESVLFTGFLDHATLSKWYKASDAFVMMCPIETQCLALMQAFATGLPSVGVDAGAVGEHIQSGWGRKVPDGDHQALASALRDILADPKRIEMGKKARAYVERFSEEVISETWEGIYERGRSKAPKISVVIPAHNEEESLPASLRAILAQEYPDFEVIVVDNASSDKTGDVARGFAGDPRVKVVREDKKGLLHARERGRREASGDIIVQMDADCLPDPDWLARGSAHFNDLRIVAVAGPYYYHDGEAFFRLFSFHTQRHIYRAANAVIQTLGIGAVLIGGNSFIRAETLEKAGGYDTSIIFYGEDTDTARRVARHGKVRFDPDLAQKTSARRFKSEGSVRTGALYLFHFFRILYKGFRN
ncbi:glycosyltransferase [Candidatus Parcubacteria bacterium]|nr:glycosyltransferase [Candidatus Parcubacteria bacterium]